MLKANYTSPQHPRTKAHRHLSVRRAVAVDISPSPVVPCRRVVRLLIIYVLKSPSPCVWQTDPTRSVRTFPHLRATFRATTTKGRWHFALEKRTSSDVHALKQIRTHTHAKTHTEIHTEIHICTIQLTHTYINIYIYRLKLISSTLLRWRYNARNLCSSVARKLLAHKRTNKI